MDASLTDDLNRCLTALRRSFLHYLSDCRETLVLTDADRPALLDMTRIGAEQAQCVDDLWDFIESMGEVPRVANYHPDLGRFNYTTLTYYLEEAQRQHEQILSVLRMELDKYRHTKAGKSLAGIVTVLERHQQELLSVGKTAGAPAAE